MPRKIAVLVVMLLATLLMLPVHAQEAPAPPTWTASVLGGFAPPDFEPQTTFVRIGANGELLTDLDLPLEESYEYIGYDYEVAPDGSFVAYGQSALSGAGDTSVTVAEITTYNLETQEIVAGYLLADDLEQTGLNNALGSLTFDDTGESLAFGYYTDSGDGTFGWQIVAIDPTTGTELGKLTSADHGSQLGTSNEEGAAYNTTVHFYRGDVVTFTLSPIFLGVEIDPVSAQWNAATGEIEVLETTLRGWGEGLAATGEIAYTYLDSALPGGEPQDEMNMPINNAVAVYDVDTGENTLVFTNPHHVGTVEFVENGAKLLISAGREMAAPVYTLVSRDGSEAVELPDIPVANVYVFGVTDGFVYYLPEEAAYYHVNTTGDSPEVTQLYQGEVNGTPDVQARFDAADLPPFLAIDVE